MTRRQYLVWMLWLPFESARIEFRRPERPRPAPPNPDWVLDADKMRRLRRQMSLAALGVGLPPGGVRLPAASRSLIPNRPPRRPRG